MLSFFFIGFLSKNKVMNTLENMVGKISNNLKVFYFKKITQLSKLLLGISNKLDRKLNKDTFIQNSLSPKLLVEEELIKIEPYIKRIDDGVRNPDIKNLALMGSYGSGKSTIIKNFTFLHPEYKILNLSLGSYSKKETSDVGDQDSNLDGLNEKLENSLVKQMIYREKNSKLPYSRFKKINHISSKKMILFFLIFIISFMSFLYLKNFLNLKDILSKNIEIINNNNGRIDFFIYISFSISSCIILFKFFQTAMTQFKLSKLNFANVSIEGNENNSSYFNKYIDEILYYFETKKFDVVIVEDVDRFRSIKVFEHLKELNILLNNSKQIDRNITFIYALKEDIFSNSEEDIEEHESEIRTKFFELIIPIIPVVDAFNSRDYLVPMMIEKYDGVLDSEFEIFLKDISLYIQDLRLLTNIVNEYFIYIDIHKSLSSSMNEHRLFSIIALKNLIPSAYTNLQKSQGFIYDLVVKKVHDDSLKLNIEDELKEIREDIQKIENQLKIDKISETKKFLFDKGVSKEDSIEVNGTIKGLQLVNIEIIDAMFEDSKEYISARRVIQGEIQIERSEFIDIIKEKDEVLKDRKQNKQKEFDLKKNELEIFYRLSLQQKLKNYPELIKLIFDKEKDCYINEKDFILYVLSNGYIAEDYPTYLSVFYEEKSMTINDKNLLVKLKSNQKIEFDDKPDNIKEFVKEFLPQDYAKKGILNVNILIYLFSTEYDDEHGMRDVVLENLFAQDEQSYLQNLETLSSSNKSDISNLFFEILKKYMVDFIARSGAEIKNKLINVIFYSCLNDISSYYQRDEREKILLDVLTIPISEYDEYGNEFDDKVYLIKENILSRPNFFVEIEDYIDSNEVMQILTEHNDNPDTSVDAEIYFKEINLEGLSQEQFNNFIKYELYGYEPVTFFGILNYKKLDVTKAVSYQQILLSDIENLIDATRRNLEMFVNGVLLKLDDLSETESSFLELVNSSVSESLKSDLIDKSNVVINQLHQVEDVSLWENFLKKKKCVITWINLKDYYETENMNLGVLKSIFNIQEDILTLKNQYNISDSKKEIKEFLKILVDKKVINVTSNNIELLKIATYDAGSLDNKAIHLLVENDLVDFNLENINIFKGNGVITELLLNHPTEFIENYKEINLLDDDLIVLIKEWEIDSIDKLLEIVAGTETEGLFQNNELVSILAERKIISNDNLFLKLLENTEKNHLKKYFIFNLQEGKLSKLVIEQVLTSFYENDMDDFSLEQYNSIFDNIADSDLFIKLLNNIFMKGKLDSSSIDKVMDWLGTQNKPISEIYIGQNSEVIIKNSSENKKLVENLKNIGLVSKITETDENTLSIYNKRKHPKIKQN